MQVMEEFQSSSQFESHIYNFSSSFEEIISNNSNMNISASDERWTEEQKQQFFYSDNFQLAAHVLYNIVLVLGLIGNGFVLLLFSLRTKPFRKLPTPLLANLAVGDLLITIFCLETGYLSLLWQYWPFGKFLCFALSPVKPIAVFVSCYTLIALSVDRYLGVKNPLNPAVLSKEKVSWTIGIIWGLAFITSLPSGLFTSYEIHMPSKLPRCGEYAWDSEIKEMIYDLVLMSLQFFAPLLVLIYTYSRISIVVCKSRLLRHRMSQGTSPNQKSLRTIRMSLMVVLGYVTAWLPFNAVALLEKYNRTLGDSDHFPYIFISCHWLAMSHSVYNPIIYFWMNKSFRTTVLDLFCWKRAKERRRQSSSLFSWRNSTVYTSNGRSSTSNGRSSIGKPACKCRMKQLKSPSESSTCHELSLLKIPNGVGDIIISNQPDESTIIIISDGGDNNGYISKEKLSQSSE